MKPQLGLNRELGEMPIGSKTNSGAATYARGKKDLQGMALILGGNGGKGASTLRKQPRDGGDGGDTRP